ncbi:ABC transporter permease [Terasakiella pusilla]|uniref:ABC transporter permease n=1 Tax=Terasakiella pusilla TaxID=64973 RepID=UPI003AA9C24F
MFFSFRRSAAVLVKEFIQLRRDTVTLRMIIMIPVIQLLLFGYALNTDPKHLPTAVLSYDNSPTARTVIAGLKNTEYFSIEQDIHSEQQGQDLLRRGEVLFVVTIPAGFERDIIRGQSPDLLIEADGSDPVAAAGALSAANGMLQRILNQELTGPLAKLQQSPPAFKILTHRLYNPEGFTRYNIVPGLVAIILTMTGIMMTALAMTRERERGTMENLLAMPISPLEVMMGKITPYVLIGFFQSALIIIAASLLFGVPIIGSLWLFFAALSIFIVCNMALGFTISAAAKNQTQALQLSIMILLPSILLSGFMFPFLGMPIWAQYLGNLIPATHFIAISRGILLKGSTFVDIWPHLWPLLVFMVAITCIAILRYRRTLD